ncbi:MAG: CHAT domain-containing protein [Acidobacteria bacterium]|nr:CHAT domain-containing protein [Acidobacteriota bacterium]
MNDSKFNDAVHPPETLIAAYAIGKCSAEAQAGIDEHCFTCESCRIRLSILLRLSSLDDNEPDRRELERLFPLGKETIAQARQPIAKLLISNDNRSSTFDPTNQNTSTKRAAQPKKHERKNRYALALACLFFLAVIGTAGYLYIKSHSPVQNSLLAMQHSYQVSRPLEARLSGGFPYKPYARSRGNVEGADVNRDQLDYALAELTKEVAINPTPQERHALGRLYLFLGEFDKAETQMKGALEFLKRDAKLHTDLATLYYERSKYAEGDSSGLLDQAVSHYDVAIEIDPRLTEAWFNRALCYEKLSLFTRAKESWKEYLNIDSTSEWAKEAREHLKKLELKASRESTPKKKEIITSFEKIFDANDDNALASLINQNPSIIGQFAINELTEYYLTASIENNSTQSDLAYAKLKKIANFFADNREDFFIRDLTDLAARASPAIKHRMLSVLLELRQADNEISRSLYDSAYKTYQSALHNATRIKDDLHAEVAVANLVRFSHNRANSDSLVSLGNHFTIQAEKRHHKHMLFQLHSALANAYLSDQEISHALESSLRAVTLAKEIGDKDFIMAGLILAGTAYTRSGNYRAGLSKSFEVLSILNNNPTNQIRNFQAYQQLWEPLFRLGNYKLALEYQMESLNIASQLKYNPGITGTMGRIGLNLWKLNRNQEAEKYLTGAIEKCDLIDDKTIRPLLQAELFTTLGDVFLSLGRHESSLDSYTSALKAIKSTNNRVYLSAIHQGLASAYLSKNGIQEAEQEFKRSIALLEKGRQQIADASSRSVFLLRSQNVYKSMIDFQFYIKNNQALAFDYSEIAKNRNILETAAGSSSTTTTDGKIVLPISSRFNLLKLKEIQNKLPSDVQALSYVPTEKGLLIFYITKINFISTSVKVSDQDLLNLVTTYTSSLRDRQNLETIRQQSANLYQLLITPILHNIDSSKSISIIQDNTLSHLPFATLYSLQSKRYLVEDYSIITNPSANLMVKTKAWSSLKQNDKDESFLGISNPRFSHSRFPKLTPLPSAEDEVFKASALYKNSKFFSLQNAAESKIIPEFQGSNIVHIASHTINSEISSLASAIILADENPLYNKNIYHKGIFYDGLLQASEIYSLRATNTKLVVLSSCKSGIDEAGTGEATGALVQAFLSIKVPSVIASLWDVDDESSAELMYLFHFYHRTKSFAFASSLREAQCSLIHGADETKRHPYYWGAFQIFGAGN